jgi:hypothetical protein
MAGFYTVSLLADDGLRHLSKLGAQSLCGRRTRVQASFPNREPCTECVEAAEALEPPAKPQPKQHPDSAVKVTQGPEAALPKQRSQKTELSLQLRALAKTLGRDPKELAESIPADTLRRLKAPVLESANPDGTRKFEHDLKIRNGVRATGRS